MRFTRAAWPQHITDVHPQRLADHVRKPKELDI
jgi:hypothetical protein